MRDAVSGNVSIAPKAGRFLGTTLFLSALIISTNFLIGRYVPITTGLEDEFYLIGNVWRAAQGQHVGIDYHDALGFGPFQIAALFWRLLGPHYYVLRLAASAIGACVVLCGCIIAARRLAHARHLGVLLCITIAYEATAPSTYGTALKAFGVAMFFDRLSDAALAVLFLQAFGQHPIREKRGDWVEVVIAGVLLDILFLTKISGLLLGVATIAAGLLLCERVVRGLALAGITVSLFAALAAVELWGTGLHLGPLVHEYVIAGQARAEVLSGFVVARSTGHIVLPLAALLAFTLARGRSELRLSSWVIFVLVSSYAALEGLLDLENSRLGGPTLFLAPAAIAAVVGRLGWRGADALPAHSLRPSWRNLHPDRLLDVSARDAIPYLIFAAVAIPQIAAALVGAWLCLISGPVPVVLGAGRGVSFTTDAQGDAPQYVPALARAITLLAKMGAGDKVIAALDFTNPFPALFAAPSPKGVYASFDDRTLPRSLILYPEDVIGDACFVSVLAPRFSLTPDPSIVRRLTAAAMPQLNSAFELVYRDEWWSIYRRKEGCAGASRAGRVS